MAPTPTVPHGTPATLGGGAIRLEHLLALPAAELAQDGPVAFAGVRADTRTLVPGELFVALTGGTRDGHDFAAAAAAAGAAGLLVSRALPELPEGVAVVRVPDTLAALQQLAAAHRQRSDARVLAVTGSVGKTTTKAMLAGVLRARHEVHASEASFNNHLGVPLTLLGLDARHGRVVAEVGTNHRGEIDALARLVDPDVAVLTTIGYAHVGNFASRDELAEEKTDLLRRVRPGGLWLVNGDDPLVAAASARIDRPDVTVVRVGFGPENDLRAADVTVTETATTARVEAGGRSVPLRLPGAGRHLVHSALLALAAGREDGVDLATGAAALAATPLPAGRSRLDRLSDELLVVDDSYNAAPDAMLSALDLLAQLPGTTKLAVLGEMGELGDLSEELHRVVGTRAGGSATDLVAVGPGTAPLVEAAVAAGLAADRTTVTGSALGALEAARQVLDRTGGPAVVLVKGARFRHMERVHLGLSGTRVGCPLELCTLYISCSRCPKLPTG